MSKSHMTKAFVMPGSLLFVVVAFVLVWFFVYLFFKGPLCQCIDFISTASTLYWDSTFGPRYLLFKVTSLTSPRDSAKNVNPFTKALDFCAAVYGVFISLFILCWFQGLRSSYKSTAASLAMATNVEGYQMSYAFEDCYLSKNKKAK